MTDVWKLGVTGRNVTVAVVDDGLEWDNPDIKPNYNPLGSIDLNDNDNDPMPNEKNGNSPNNGRQILSCMKSVILRPVPVQSAFCIIMRVFIGMFELNELRMVNMYVVLQDTICTLTEKSDLMVSQLLGLEPKLTP